ncbi:putative membrane protein [Desulfosporosinus sp. OT]|nr:putative membrane protein [Desulfosporosinus sp. OT]
MIAVALTGRQAFLGGLIGYWVGFGYTVWIYNETQRSSELDIHSALKRMRRSLVARLGMVTLVVAAVARFQSKWLLSLALGIATGVIISFITVAIHKLHGERGDKRSA